MSIIRVNKNKNYTTMSNFHLREKDMSLKAKGLLSQMLSLPDNWDYSIMGLTKINKESYDAIRAILKELEVFGYLHRTQLKNDKGVFTDVEYTIYEKPILENPLTENPITDNPLTEKPIQLNTKENKKLNNKITKDIFKKPTLEQVQEYCRERKNNINPERFINYYDANGWVQGKGKPIKDWKACVRTWEQNSNSKDKPSEITPQWFSEEIPQDNTSKEEWEAIKSTFK